MKIDLGLERTIPPKMILHTFQSPEVYDLVVNQRKVYHCDIDKSNEILDPFCRDHKMPNFVKAYDWMSDQMSKRIGPPPSGVTYPVWAWYSLRGQRKLDFRWSEFRYRDEGYIIQIQKNVADVLLSDEVLFCAVLNDQFLNIQAYENTYESVDQSYQALPTDEQEAMKVNSWNHIFVPPISVDIGWYSAGYHMQATFWELRPEDVIQTQYLKSRYHND